MKLAQLISPVPGTHVAGQNNDIATIKGFEWIFNNVIVSIISLAGIVLFAMLLVGGFKYLTAAGNPENVASAQKTISYAIIGIVIVALAYLIIVIIETLTGARLSVFRVDVP